MRTGTIWARALAVAAGAGAIYLSAAGMQAQAVKSRASKYAVSPAFNPSYVAPRTADGQPDLQGVYNHYTLTAMSRPKEYADKEFFTEAEAVAIEKKAATTPCKEISFDLRYINQSPARTMADAITEVKRLNALDFKNF